MSPLFVFFFTILSASAGVLAECQYPCVCQFAKSKKNAECPNGNLAAIPRSLDPDSENLDLSGNAIKKLQREEFKKARLVNLQSIDLSNNGLQEIDEDAFRDVINLVELDLSNNKLTHIESDTFPRWLQHLNLNNNMLKSIGQFNFLTLPHLKVLELEGCQIETIHPKAFLQLAALEVINLKRNKIQNLDKDAFKETTHLSSILIEDNPWSCDCKLRGFRDWYISRNFNDKALTCKQPASLKNQLWTNVPATQFAC